MTGGCTYPIYYQRLVSVDKRSVIIRYKKHKLACQKMFLRRRTSRSRSHGSSMTMAGSRTLLSRSHVSSMTMAGSRTMLSRSHVSSMTGGCTCSINYQGVVSVKKGSVIIRYKLAELIKSFSGALSCSHVSSMTRRGVKPCSPAAMFQA